MWVKELEPLFSKSITTEYASLTAKGQPITFPVTPYVGDNTLDVSTGLAYPSKAERARRNPKVALLYSDNVGHGMGNAPVALVYGYGAVRDHDLQANTNRYLKASLENFPEAYATMPRFMLKRMNWYFARIWVEVTPIKILWWERNGLDGAPQEWHAADFLPSPSDPAPQGANLGAWKEGSPDWHTSTRYAVERMGNPVLTVVDNEGFPVPFRVKHASAAPEGFQLEFYGGMPAPAQGLAALTFHTHPEVFTGQENLAYVGTVRPDGRFRVERQLADWSIKGNAITKALGFMSNGRALAPRLQQEAARRGQPIPVVNLP